MARPGYPSYGPSTGEYPLDDPSARFAGMFNRLRRGVKESPAGASAAQAARGVCCSPWYVRDIKYRCCLCWFASLAR
jgi:hypothetical protein